tara:strand:+ start:113 stop:676 length:564 start_codon:yes stop_codon:yes gene_type:complete
VALDSSNIRESLTLNVIGALEGFASLDADWENPIFKMGFPDFDNDLPLSRPLVAVYIQNTETTDVAYDNIVDTNGLYLSDPNFEFYRGVSLLTTVYIDIFVSHGSPTFPVASGGSVVGERIAGKIETRLLLNPECLDEAVTIETPITSEGPLFPTDTNQPNFVLYRVTAPMEVLVTQKLNADSFIAT